jgi:hypothetical protein
VPGAAMRVLEGHGHVCLIAPGVDLRELLHDWRTARGVRSTPHGYDPAMGSAAISPGS